MKMNFGIVSLGAVGVLATLFSGCFFGPSAKENVPTSSSSLSSSSMQDSAYAWEPVLRTLNVDGKWSSRLVQWNGSLYFYTSEGNLYKDDFTNPIKTGWLDPAGMMVADNQLWMIPDDADTGVVHRLSADGVFSTWKLDSSFSPHRDSGWQFMPNAFVEHEGALLMLGSEFNPRTTTGRGLIWQGHPDGMGGYKWSQFDRTGWDSIISSTNSPWMPYVAGHVGGQLVVGTWDQGLIRYDGSRWHQISFEPDNTGWSSPRRFRDEFVYHEDRLVGTDMWGRTYWSKDGADWHQMFRAEASTSSGKYDSILKYKTHKDTSTLNGQAGGLLSHEGELYFGNSASRRNFRDSIWEMIVQFSPTRAWKAYEQGKGFEFIPQYVPGIARDIVIRNDSLYAAVSSVKDGYDGLWVLDLRKHRDSTWAAEQLRANPGK